ncbi:hypothetical protein [Moraxella cuniculi]|uniref:hypothetical protein n=1 Tax=Moraxella cuniculi TaxID=34061 RepID=UPI000F829892|nr:hypothetical protein [Moraxella cuniculi]
MGITSITIPTLPSIKATVSKNASPKTELPLWMMSMHNLSKELAESLTYGDFDNPPNNKQDIKPQSQ